ncbi:hypothetical protein Tco_0829223 [Tanacetum coccineum]
MLWLVEFINDEPIEHVHGAQETSENDMDVYIAANNAADTDDTLDESVRVQVDKTENRKVPRKARKDKLVALAAKRKIKQGEKVNHGSNGQGVSVSHSAIISHHSRKSIMASQEETQQETQDQPPLWEYVTKLEKQGASGGVWKFQCNLCSETRQGSYSRVRAHLLGIKGHLCSSVLCVDLIL